jgi:hypothetical protein
MLSEYIPVAFKNSQLQNTSWQELVTRHPGFSRNMGKSYLDNWQKVLQNYDIK